MAEAIAQPACPLPLDVLPATFQKHVDPKAPAPLRMMGAKALVPMGPKDMATALFMLTFDADANVRETAAKSAAGLPDRMLSVALRDETADPRVLDYYVSALGSKLEYLEMLVLNPSTPDEAPAPQNQPPRRHGPPGHAGAWPARSHPRQRPATGSRRSRTGTGTW